MSEEIRRRQHKKVCGLCGEPAQISINVTASTVGKKVRKQATSEATLLCIKCVSADHLLVPIGKAVRMLEL